MEMELVMHVFKLILGPVGLSSSCSFWWEAVLWLFSGVFYGEGVRYEVIAPLLCLKVTWWVILEATNQLAFSHRQPISTS